MRPADLVQCASKIGTALPGLRGPQLTDKHYIANYPPLSGLFVDRVMAHGLHDGMAIFRSAGIRTMKKVGIAVLLASALAGCAVPQQQAIPRVPFPVAEYTALPTTGTG